MPTMGIGRGALACASYAVFSTSLTLTNKHVFSQHFDQPCALLGLQSLVVALFLALSRSASGAHPFSFTLACQMLIPSILFCLYIYTNARALRAVSLPVFAVLKSLAPVGIALVERLLFRDLFSPPIAAAMALVVLANTVTIVTDLEFSPVAYTWALANVVVNVAYVISLRLCLSATFSPLQKTIHSNLLAACFLLPFSFHKGELRSFVWFLHTAGPSFQAVYVASCVLAAGIGASVFWVVQTTSGSTLSFVGACNKFSVVVLGGLLFEARVSPLGWLSVSLGVLAGIIFALAKAKCNGEKSVDDDINLHEVKVRCRTSKRKKKRTQKECLDESEGDGLGFCEEDAAVTDQPDMDSMTSDEECEFGIELQKKEGEVEEDELMLRRLTKSASKC